ncbi:MAG: TIM barrel protein [Rectinemataceae bacterium]|jgi:ribulose-phosphate 3-epimerase
MTGDEGQIRFEFGVKSDPIEYRYSFDWLFLLMRRMGLRRLQLGSFFELYDLEDGWFLDLRELAASRGIAISSVFTAHRELGGFFSGDPRMELVARRNYERLIEVAALVGARYVGSNPGAVYRDRMGYKGEGLRRYVRHMKELSRKARELGLEALTVEPMSCSAEPPSSMDEIGSLMEEFREFHAANPSSSLPVYLCGDVSHGLADREGNLVHGNMELFEYEIPWTCEFHIKNTDAAFASTFGFSPADRERGIVEMKTVFDIARRRAAYWPVREVVGYLEIGGPKLGRDYSDYKLERQLEESIAHIMEESG